MCSAHGIEISTRKWHDGDMIGWAYDYELRTVGGYRMMPWTWGSREQDRAEIKKLSGTNEVPFLVLDDGEVVSGSGTIARWAKEHPNSPAKAA